MEKEKRKVPKVVWIAPLVLAGALLIPYLGLLIIWSVAWNAPLPDTPREEEIVYGEYGDAFRHEYEYFPPILAVGGDYEHKIFYKEKELVNYSISPEKSVTLAGIYNENGYTAYLILGRVFYKKAGEDAFYELADTYDDETKPILYAAVLAGCVKSAEPLIRDGDQEAIDILKEFAHRKTARLSQSLSENKKDVLRVDARALLEKYGIPY